MWVCVWSYVARSYSRVKARHIIRGPGGHGVRLKRERVHIDCVVVIASHKLACLARGVQRAIQVFPLGDLHVCLQVHEIITIGPQPATAIKEF